MEKGGFFEKTFPRHEENYCWYSNNKINVNKLAIKITKNNIEHSLPVLSTSAKLIRTTAKAISLVYEYLKKNYPKFDFNFMLYAADNVQVREIDFEQNVALYNGADPYIGFNMDNIFSDEELLQAACHEAFHMANGNNYQNNEFPLYHEGCSYDVLTNSNTALSYEFISEQEVDEMAYAAMGEYEEAYYYRENEMLDFITYSTGQDQQYYRTAYVYGDQDSMIDAMEPEFQDFKTAYSLYTYACNCCGYASYEGINCDEKFELECFEKFRTLCLQNLYTRLIKSYFNNEISYSELKDELRLYTAIYRNAEYDCCTDNVEYEKNVKKLTKIVDNLQKDRL